MNDGAQPLVAKRRRAGSVAAKRIPRQTLSGQLCEQIRIAVLDGTYPLGSQLNELDLAETFGVSRGPVREALQRLIQEGLLTSEPHRGVFVTELNEEDLKDIFFVRGKLEMAAMERVMALPDRSALQRTLVGVVKQMEKAVQRQNWPLVAELDMEFHHALVSAARSHRLSRVYDTVQAETKLCLRMMMGGYRGNQALIDEHKLLTELVGGDDVEAAVSEINRHFGNPARTLRKANALRQERTSDEAA
ncbi:GntR family transcriptional regulator [Terrarubrum flagellatum]|uniref:GntR family transcriptional regulator n=1 Tax=Terrirubrum flagellatum TaxID=2895980 RepID=UPI003145498B